MSSRSVAETQGSLQEGALIPPGYADVRRTNRSNTPLMSALIRMAQNTEFASQQEEAALTGDGRYSLLLTNSLRSFRVLDFAASAVHQAMLDAYRIGLPDSKHLTHCVIFFWLMVNMDGPLADRFVLTNAKLLPIQEAAKLLLPDVTDPVSKLHASLVTSLPPNLPPNALRLPAIHAPMFSVPLQKRHNIALTPIVLQDAIAAAADHPDDPDWEALRRKYEPYTLPAHPFNPPPERAWQTALKKRLATKSAELFYEPNNKQEEWVEQLKQVHDQMVGPLGPDEAHEGMEAFQMHRSKHQWFGRPGEW